LRLQTHTFPSLTGTFRKRCKPAHNGEALMNTIKNIYIVSKPNLRQEPSSSSRPSTRTEQYNKHENNDRMNKGQLVIKVFKSFGGKVPILRALHLINMITV